MSQRDTIVHLVAGGAGGTAGAIVTCPLEVVKTRLQSSVATFDRGHHHHQSGHSSALRSASARTHTGRVYTGVGGDAVMQQQQAEMRYHLSTCSSSASNGSATILRGSSPSALYGTLTEPTGNVPRRPTSLGVWRCLRCIVETEGPKALFKGLGPNLVGVAPSRAIYFYTYSSAKTIFNDQLTPDSASVHMCSAVCAGFAACTTTNPIWFVKTRLQLDQKKNGGLTTLDCVRDIYRSKGIAGFYKGITASYFGISETVIHFVIYEAIKARLRDRRVDCGNEKTASDFAEYMLAGATSKTCASIIAYPHEVARTRLRQDGDKYRSFWQTLVTVFREEGHRGVYRGLGTQLIRQIPNTALMMATYEAVVYLLSNPPNHQDDGGGGDSSSSSVVGVDVAGEFCCAEVDRNGG